MKQLSELRDEVSLWTGLEQRINDAIELSDLNDPDLQIEIEKESSDNSLPTGKTLSFYPIKREI